MTTKWDIFIRDKQGRLCYEGTVDEVTKKRIDKDKRTSGVVAVKKLGE